MSEVNNNHVVGLLSEAISATLGGNTAKATKLTATALRILATTAPTKPSKTTKLGAPPLLNEEIQKELCERVSGGESIASVARRYRIPYQTAFRYVSKARNNAKVSH